VLIQRLLRSPGDYLAKIWEMIHGTTRLRDRHRPAMGKTRVKDGSMPLVIPRC